MLKRQRALLYMLQSRENAVSKTALTQWCFLLKHETSSQGGSSFYDFLPYKYGPFSFCLYQEMRKLQDAGLVNEQSDGHWVLADRAEFPAPGDDVIEDIGDVLDNYGVKESPTVGNYIYRSYPEYTCRSELKKLAPLPLADTAVYSAGYEGASVDRFLNGLVQTGIRQLVDVRNNPIARRYGFHKSTLRKLCSSLEINYLHFANLGILSEDRQNLSDQDCYKQLFQNYRETTLKQQQSDVNAVCDLVRVKPSVLVCMEAEPSCCHRNDLAKLVAKQTTLPVVHLRMN